MDPQRPEPWLPPASPEPGFLPWLTTSQLPPLAPWRERGKPIHSHLGPCTQWGDPQAPNDNSTGYRLKRPAPSPNQRTKAGPVANTKARNEQPMVAETSADCDLRN